MNKKEIEQILEMNEQLSEMIDEVISENATQTEHIMMLNKVILKYQNDEMQSNGVEVYK